MQEEAAAVEQTDPEIRPRLGIVWRCSKPPDGCQPLGRQPRPGCGRYHPCWTWFDPNVGGNRTQRWLGRCECGKTTSISPTRGNIVAGPFTVRQEAIDFANRLNTMKAGEEE